MLWGFATSVQKWKWPKDGKYDKGRARRLLKMNGYADLNDFIPANAPRTYETEFGWRVTISHNRSSRAEAVTRFLENFAGVPGHGSTIPAFIHHSFCLLRLADPTSSVRSDEGV